MNKKPGISKGEQRSIWLSHQWSYAIILDKTLSDLRTEYRFFSIVSDDWKVGYYNHQQSTISNAHCLIILPHGRRVLKGRQNYLILATKKWKQDQFNWRYRRLNWIIFSDELRISSVELKIFSIQLNISSVELRISLDELKISSVKLKISQLH